MIAKEDLERLKQIDDSKVQRSLRRKETFLNHSLVKRLIDEIRRLQKGNQFLCRKLKEKGINDTETKKIKY